MVIDLILTFGDQQSTAIPRVIAEIQRQIGARHHCQVGAITRTSAGCCRHGIGGTAHEVLAEMIRSATGVTNYVVVRCTGQSACPPVRGSSAGHARPPGAPHTPRHPRYAGPCSDAAWTSSPRQATRKNQVEARRLQVAVAAGYRGRHQAEVIVALGAIESRKQLWQQARGRCRLGFDDIGRVIGTDPDLLPSRLNHAAENSSADSSTPRNSWRQWEIIKASWEIQRGFCNLSLVDNRSVVLDHRGTRLLRPTDRGSSGHRDGTRWWSSSAHR